MFIVYISSQKIHAWRMITYMKYMDIVDFYEINYNIGKHTLYSTMNPMGGAKVIQHRNMKSLNFATRWAPTIAISRVK